MPIPGTFGGFPFDPEVYQGFVDQEATFSDSILASGILASDQSLAASLDNGGTMGTIRFYNPLDPDTDAPLVRDGTNDNIPAEISGGEKQRIAIARMMLKNAPIVILDEATAFTDPENEDKLQRSIAALTKGKTLLVIAHRLSTIKNADNIVVLKNGAIEAAGTQEELFVSCPLYKDMWLAHIGAQNWAVSAAEKEA